MRILRAYIDESGQRGLGGGSSDHFVMGAVVFFEETTQHASDVLAEIRKKTNRLPVHELHWNKLKAGHKQAATAVLGASTTNLRYCTVVVCKKELERNGTFNQDMAYLLTLRYLLERLSWVARDRNRVLKYTVAHIKNFKIAKLREYEARLRAMPPSECKVAWDHIDPAGGSIDQPKRNEHLQLADMVSSAVGDAFNGDRAGTTETAYLRALSPYFYRRNGNLTSYGLKMHPWRDTTKAAYPWVAAL